MKTLQTEPNHYSKQRGIRFWISRIIFLIGLAVVAYYGYCSGLWGRNSLLLQYLFQCSCPAFSEEWRYPRRVDVIVPACRNVDASVRLSPSGRFLYVRKEKDGLTSAHFLDLQTMEKIKVTDQPFSSFLTDDLWFVEAGIESYIIDRTTGKQSPIKIFRYWQVNAYVNGEPNLELLVTALHQADQVFFSQNNDTVIALMPDFSTNLGQNFTFDRSDIPGGDSNRVEQFLREKNITYQTILEDFPDEALSPDGRFVARNSGIYLVETDRRIVRGISRFLIRGWINDGSRAIYTSHFPPCLLRVGVPFVGDDTWCEISVPQPVLLLKVPEEYLSPPEGP
jgi:hypothetical protein